MTITALVQFLAYGGGYTHTKIVEFECESEEKAIEIINNAVATQDEHKYQFIRFI